MSPIDQPEPPVARKPRLRRLERREQILAAATETFADRGFAATNVDDLAASAGVSRMILYRHFESKADIYRAALDRARARLRAVVVWPGSDRPDGGTMRDSTEQIIAALVTAASADPAGFRLLFYQAAREPEFRAEMDQFHNYMVKMAHTQLDGVIADPHWAKWAAHLIPTATIESILAWLDVGQPEPASAATRIHHAVNGILTAAGGGS